MPEFRDACPKWPGKASQAVEEAPIKSQAHEQCSLIGPNYHEASSEISKIVAIAARYLNHTRYTGEDKISSQDNRRLHMPFTTNENNIVGRNASGCGQEKF